MAGEQLVYTFGPAALRNLLGLLQSDVVLGLRTAGDLFNRLEFQAGGIIVTGDGTVPPANAFSGGGTHPNLATHDAMGLATDAELTTHKNDTAPHPNYTAPGHPNLATHDALGLATDAELATHTGATAPHSGHEATANKNAANGYAGLGADGKVAQAQLPQSSFAGQVFEWRTFN